MTLPNRFGGGWTIGRQGTRPRIILNVGPVPKAAPPLSVFIPMLAELGGYNNRSSDHPPGPQAIWVGIRRMTDFAIAWTAFGPKDDT